MKLPPLEYRLLAAFRIWAIINYFFPYKELMDENWDNVLLDFIPKMEQANSPLAYHLTVAEMITHINDSHGSVDSPVLKEYFGPAWPPVRLQLIENVPVITTILDEEAVRNAGVNRGDIVLRIDGEDALTRIGDRAKYSAASTPHRLMYRAALASLSGPEGSFAILSIRDRNNSVQEVKLKRKVEYGNIRLPERNGEIFKLISDDIGYADLDRLEVPMVDEMFEKFKDTKAITFDMRGYPKSTAWAIASRLTNKSDIGAALFQCPVAATPDGTSDGIVSQTITYSFVQSLSPPEKWRYEGKTVMLIDERTQSQAEHTGLFFRAANGTKFIGSHSSGANGDVTNFFVPGGINIRITGQSVKHADGRQLQRVGLVPDIEVKPTIQGIQNDEDEVLACAINYLQHELGEGKSKQ
jgi:C-terminal processing protease CtpA/Prc